MSEEYKRQWPTWVIIVAILILAIPIIWGLAVLTNLLAAMSIGGILIVAGIIGVFVGVESCEDRHVRGQRVVRSGVEAPKQDAVLCDLPQGGRRIGGRAIVACHAVRAYRIHHEQDDALRRGDVSATGE